MELFPFAEVAPKWERPERAALSQQDSRRALATDGTGVVISGLLLNKPNHLSRGFRSLGWWSTVTTSSERDLDHNTRG